MKKSKLLSVILIISIAVSSLFFKSSSPQVSLAFGGQLGSAAVVSVIQRIRNDIPEPRRITDVQGQTSVVFTELRKGHRQFLRGYDRIVDGRYLIYEDPSSSYEHSVFFYDIFIHPGDVIIRFIHDQDGEKDRAFL